MNAADLIELAPDIRAQLNTDWAAVTTAYTETQTCPWPTGDCPCPVIAAVRYSDYVKRARQLIGGTGR